MLKKVVMKQAENSFVVYYIESRNVSYIQVSYCDDNTKVIKLYMQDKANEIFFFTSSDDRLINKFIDLFNGSNSIDEVEINLNY